MWICWQVCFENVFWFHTTPSFWSAKTNSSGYFENFEKPLELLHEDLHFKKKLNLVDHWWLKNSRFTWAMFTEHHAEYYRETLLNLQSMSRLISSRRWAFHRIKNRHSNASTESMLMSKDDLWHHFDFLTGPFCFAIAKATEPGGNSSVIFSESSL